MKTYLIIFLFSLINIFYSEQNSKINFSDSMIHLKKSSKDFKCKLDLYQEKTVFPILDKSVMVDEKSYDSSFYYNSFYINEVEKSISLTYSYSLFFKECVVSLLDLLQKLNINILGVSYENNSPILYLGGLEKKENFSNSFPIKYYKSEHNKIKKEFLKLLKAIFMLILIPFKIIYFFIEAISCGILDLLYFIISNFITKIYYFFDKRIYTKFYLENSTKSFYYETKISLFINKILLPNDAFLYLTNKFKNDYNCFNLYNFELEEELICSESVVNDINKNEKIVFVLNGVEYYFNKNDIFFKENGKYKLIFAKTNDDIIEIGLEFFRKYPIEINLRKNEFTIYSNISTKSKLNSNNNIDNL